MNNKFKLIYLNIFKLLAFILPYEVAYGQVHPFLLKDEPEMYSEAYFGMAFEDFKSKFTNKIIECKVNPSKVLMDKGCKVSFNFSGGATEGVAAFKDDKFVGIVAKVNSDKYDNLNSDFSNIFKTSPQIENREEKKGIFSEKISNQYSFWRFPDYLLAINKYDLSKFEKNGTNFSLIIETGSNELIKELEVASKKNKIEIKTQTATIDIHNSTKLSPTDVAVSINSTTVIPKAELNEKMVNQGGINPYSKNLVEFSPNFKGNDLKALLIHLKENGKSLGIFKDEFTSKSQFMQQANKATAELNQAGNYIFVMPKSINGTDFNPNYNADKGWFEISVIFSSFDGYSKEKFATDVKLSGLNLISELSDRGSYEASNAYGKSVTVSKLDKINYSLAFGNLNKYKLDVLIPMSPDEARASKGDLTLAFVCKLNAPPFLEYDNHLDPKINFPYEVDNHFYLLNTSLLSVYVINSKTGKIYKKL